VKAPEVKAGAFTVYVTRSGKKYHAAGCRFVSRGEMALSLEDAKKQGYAPCAVCNPAR
jgi:micrococcal nuclease